MNPEGHSMRTVGVALLASLVAGVPWVADAKAWPRVTAQSGAVVIIEQPQQGIRRVIRGKQGKVLYLLTCMTGDSGADSGDEEFDYSGFIHCRLREPKPQTWPRTLLQPNDSTRDWEGRARFLLGEVVGPCGATPDYGASRTFHLRGMRLHLAVDQVRVDARNKPFYVSRFRLSYDVRPDATATTPTPAPVAPEPSWFNRDNLCEATELARVRHANREGMHGFGRSQPSEAVPRP